MPRDLPTSLWAAALVRRAEVAGAFAAIVHKGDAERGDVLVKVVSGQGEAQLYAPAFAIEGAGTFERLFPDVAAAPEADVDAQIDRRRRSDRDLWVIEISDRAGRHFLTEAVR